MHPSQVPHFIATIAMLFSVYVVTFLGPGTLAYIFCENVRTDLIHRVIVALVLTYIFTFFYLHL